MESRFKEKKTPRLCSSVSRHRKDAEPICAQGLGFIDLGLGFRV